MNTQLTKAEWGFWRAWVLASMAGFAMGTILGCVAYGLFANTNPAAVGISFGLALGAMGGVLQWGVMGDKVARSGWWVLANALGCAIGLGTVTAAGAIDNPITTWLLFAAACGIPTAIMQWLVLRQHFARAGWWVPASLLGTLVAATGLPTSIAIGWTVNFLQAALVFALFFGVGFGVIPGAALVWLLRQPLSSRIEGPVIAR